jgi:hypothetical protein
MELDDLKSAWAQYDKKLTSHLKLNEELLKKWNLESAKRELQKPLQYELMGVAGQCVLIFATIVFSFKVIDEPKYCVPGFIAVVFEIVGLVFAMMKANRFLNIDHYGTPILKLQKEIASLNKLVLQLRKYELMLIPLVALPSLPLLFIVFKKIDIYSEGNLFATAAFLILGLGFPLTLWINKYLYDKKFQASSKLLKEIEDFELNP